jgi:hypothetical protein
MLPDTRMKNIDGLGVGISIAFEIFSNFPFLWGGVDPKGHIYCISYIACNTRDKDMYGLGVEGSQ